MPRQCYMSEVIITVGHQSITTGDRPLDVANGQVWPVINALLERSYLASQAATQRRLRATFKKWQKEHEIEQQTLSWLQCDLDARGKHVVSIALYVGSTKPTYACWKTSGETGSMARQTREQATWWIMLLVTFTKLPSWKSRAMGESAATSSTIGRLLSSMDKETQGRMAKKFDVCFMMAKESLPFTKYPVLLELESRHGVDYWAQPTACPIQWRHLQATLLRASTRPSWAHCQALITFFFSFLMELLMLVTKKTNWLFFRTALRMLLPKRSLHALATYQSTPQEKVMQMVYFHVLMRLKNL